MNAADVLRRMTDFGAISQQELKALLAGLASEVITLRRDLEAVRTAVNIDRADRGLCDV